MSFLASKRFWVESAERSVKTFAQAAVAILTADVAGLLSVDWVQVFSIAGLSALVSVLTSIASGASTKSDSPSLVPEVSDQLG